MKIIIVSRIFSETVSFLKKTHDVIYLPKITKDELIELIKDRNILILRSGINVSRDVLSQAKHLKLIIRAGSGLDNIDTEFMKTLGIKLARIPKPGARAVAELSFTFMLTLSRQIFKADSLLRKGKWAKNELDGFVLKGKTLGIIGLGNIGLQVAHLGKAWGMDIIACANDFSASRAEMLYKKEGICLVNFNEVIEKSDYLSIHVPLNDSTKNLFKKNELASMKAGAYLINLSRGGVVDEHALFQELTTEGRIAGAALDVHLLEGEGKISPLANLDNVILTPHIGSTTIDTQKEIGQEIIKIIKLF